MCVLSIELVWVEIYGKMGEKPQFLDTFEVWYRYHTVWYRYHIGSGRLVLVPKGWYRYPMLWFWTSVSILTITWPFLIRFECFKWLVKLDFKDNKSPCNRYLQIRTPFGPESHSKWGYVHANFWFCFEHRVVPVV